MRVLFLCLAATGLFTAATPSFAHVIGRAVSADEDAFLSFDQPDSDYDIAGDMFGIRSRDLPDPPDCFECPGLPSAIVDQTYDLFDPSPSDKLGLIRSEDFAPFFGVADTVNGIGNGWNTASWTFDIAGVSRFRISADMAAMGDFEAGNIESPSQDAFVFDYAIDGGPFGALFESSVDTAANQSYEMELPHPDTPIITLDDPLSMNGVMLNNLFQTISVEVSGTGSQLEIRFRAITDGGEEAFAFRNLIVEAIDGGGDTIDGDYNASGSVEQADLDLVLLNWGSADVPVGWTFDPPEGNIDQAELDGVLLNWGNTADFGTGAAVPEPSSLAIAAISMILMSAHAQRVRRHRLANRLDFRSSNSLNLSSML